MNYIGDQSNNLVGLQDINAINPQDPREIANGHKKLISDRPYYAQFPYLKYIDWISNLDRSSFNALQTTLTARGYRGLGFVAAYTYSHALDDNSANRNEHVPMDNFAPGLDYGNSDFDQRHHFSLTLSYAFPGRKGYGQMLEGWSVNSAVLIQSGLPWNPDDTTNDISKTGDGSRAHERWDFFGNPSDFKGGKSPIPFYDGVSAPFPAACLGHPGTDLGLGCFAKGNSVLIAPTAGTFGTSGRNVFRDDGFRDWDFSLFKSWTLKERLTAQFRVEVFNILNNAILASPAQSSGNDPATPSALGCACQTPDSAGQNPLLGTGGARAIQLGLKLLF
jgi:hypothetical protein